MPSENVAGCQALRKKIGHIIFRFRLCYGDSIFVTVTPNRRNSALLLYLSRTRVNDTCFLAANSSTQQRKQHCGSATPNFVSEHDIHSDPDGRKVRAAIPLPAIHDRQVWSAQDPLATTHQFQVLLRIVIPAIFGMRMCFCCPLCLSDQCDLDHVNSRLRPCSNVFG